MWFPVRFGSGLEQQDAAVFLTHFERPMHSTFTIALTSAPVWVGMAVDKP